MTTTVQVPAVQVPAVIIAPHTTIIAPHITIHPLAVTHITSRAHLIARARCKGTQLGIEIA
jgi:hypothetical protein